MSPDADCSPEPSVKGGEILTRVTHTFFDFSSKSPGSPAVKRIKLDGTESTVSQKSNRIRFRFCPLYQLITCYRIPLTIRKASR
jgi:hypothetical protein